MKGITNYYVKFISGNIMYLTAEEAYAVTKAWNDGAGSITIRGNVHACHQIIEIIRDRQMELDQIYDKYGISLDKSYYGYDSQKAKKFLKTHQKSLNIGGLKELEYSHNHPQLQTFKQT